MRNKKIDKSHKTTKRHFAIFKKEVLKWANKFGLIGWELYFEHPKDIPDARADVHWDISGRVATIRLSQDWGHDRPYDIMIRKCAFHETMELFLCRLGKLARARYLIDDNEILEEEHNIIRTLETILFFEGKREKVIG